MENSNQRQPLLARRVVKLETFTLSFFQVNFVRSFDPRTTRKDTRKKKKLSGHEPFVDFGVAVLPLVSSIGKTCVPLLN